MLLYRSLFKRLNLVLKQILRVSEARFFDKPLNEMANDSQSSNGTANVHAQWYSTALNHTTLGNSNFWRACKHQVHMPSSWNVYYSSLLKHGHLQPYNLPDISVTWAEVNAYSMLNYCIRNAGCIPACSGIVHADDVSRSCYAEGCCHSRSGVSLNGNLPSCIRLEQCALTSYLHTHFFKCISFFLWLHLPGMLQNQRITTWI